ncbi:MAG: TatD family hydrolase [Candidatus Kerfeldbacteria bacterium]|nr:TatD family hydrolase [Candidatus Kerfeldbacteria bacterium]
MVDTHCHLNFRAFKDDLEACLSRASEVGVNYMINPGSQYDTSKRSVELAKKYDNLYAAIGLHPIHLFAMEVDEGEDHFATRAEVFDYEKYRDLAKPDSKVVAIGECGLDYFHLPPGRTIAEVRAVQIELLKQQIKLATDLNLPMIFHCREAYEDLLEVLQAEVKQGQLPQGGVVHCFLGDREQAQAFLDLGLLLSFTGIITFKNVKPELIEVIKQTPLDKIMIETDAPYLAPAPHRGQRNEPAFVAEVAKKIADIKGISLAEVDKTTTENAQRLFRLSSLSQAQRRL